MKGKLEKTIKGQWVVRIISEETPECDTIIEHGKQLPVHPDYIKYYFLDEDADGSEVEFEIVNKLWGTNDDIISYAKLIKPKKINLEEMPKEEWEEARNTAYKHFDIKKGSRLMYKDGKEIRSYHSPKIDEMLKEIEEDDIKDWAHLTSVSKGLDGSVYQSTYLEAFIDGYNKAKETLYTEEQMIQASKYGYEFRDTTSFPEHKFEDSCINNTKQWLQSLKQYKKD